MKLIILLALILIFNNVFSQRLKIRIFSDINLKSFVFAPSTGKYNVYSDTIIVTTLDKDEALNIVQNNDSIEIKSLKQNFGIFKSIKITGAENFNYAKIKCVNPNLPLRFYDDDLLISSISNNLFIINDVELDNYVAGVVECEGGPKANIEYYKTQAIICRTYALENLSRHIFEGYYLCDNVHCQSYKGKSFVNNDIQKAAFSTNGLVIVDSTLNLITAAFHSNCGGQTVASEDVWLTNKSYLKSVKDTFCIYNRNAKWEKVIPFAQWQQYLRTNGFQLNNAQDTSIYFFPQHYRKTYYKINNDSIPLRKIRLDFNLKSTFFDVTILNKNIVLKGRGYGHAVGLCQEGAMEMAKRNYSYKEIIKFYYKNTFIVNLRSLEQFKPQ